MQKSIADCEPMETLRNAASQYGYRPMRAEAVERVLTGQASLAEVRRHVFFDTLSEMQPIPVRQTNGATPVVPSVQGPVLLNQNAARLFHHEGTKARRRGDP